MKAAWPEVGRLARDAVTFRGHPMVRSLHPTTIEVTTEDNLTARGDCIIGVSASKGCAQLDPLVKQGIRRPGAEVTIRVIIGQLSFEVRAKGDPRLDLSNPHDIVIRRSEFISDRTLAVHADRASKDVPRGMVLLLRNPSTVGTMEIEVQ
ncbi:MAG TPA: DUF371 domain-containing protein [Nitrososphaerales archaeon]|nr:DUF371 domain-containing protein [Nitrososphaerales archaeon]